MIQFSKECSNEEITKQFVSQIPWSHNIILLQKLKNTEQRIWNIKKIIENGWNRDAKFSKKDKISKK